MILLDAVYINAGGGKVLLADLIAALRGAPEVVLLLDSRLTGVDTAGFTVEKITPGEFARAAFYRKHRQRLERVFCFGNVPPPVRLRGHVMVYFHNMLLCHPVPEIGLRDRWLAAMKMKYIRLISQNADLFMVQSPSVRASLARHLPPSARIIEMPFYALPASHNPEPKDGRERWNRYAYVSNAYAHKNHAILMDAWERLARRGIYPELHLTVSDLSPQLGAKLERVRALGGRIINHGFTEVAKIYQNCGYQIYPSLMESFGLGLIEAAEAGCAVLASELPFVHQVVRPFSTFDPKSPAQIEEVVLLTYGKQVEPSSVIVKNRLLCLVDWIRNGVKT